MEILDEYRNILSKNNSDINSTFSKIAFFKMTEDIRNGLSPTNSLSLDLKGQTKEYYNKHMEQNEKSKKYIFFKN
jgi:hypothetical protein